MEIILQKSVIGTDATGTDAAPGRDAMHGVSTTNGAAASYHGIDSWNELSLSQLLTWAKCIAYDYERTKALRIIAYKFTNIPARVFLKLNQIQQAAIGEHFNFIFEKNTLSDWKIKKITLSFLFIFKRTWYGPSDQLKNVIGEEFGDADLYFSKFQQEKKEEYLDLLIAVLYRRHAWRLRDIGDSRQKFNEFTVKRRAKRFSRLPRKVKYAILLNYTGARNLLVEKNPYIFTNTNESTARNYGWPAVFHSMAGPKTGTQKEMQLDRIWNTMYILNMEEDHRRQAEANKKTA